MRAAVVLLGVIIAGLCWLQAPGATDWLTGEKAPPASANAGSPDWPPLPPLARIEVVRIAADTPAAELAALAAPTTPAPPAAAGKGQGAADYALAGWAAATPPVRPAAYWVDPPADAVAGLGNDDPFARWRALIRLTPTQAEQPAVAHRLAELLADRDLWVRRLAADRIAWAAPEAVAAAPALSALVTRDSDRDCRVAAAHALGRLRQRHGASLAEGDAVSALTQALADPDPGVQTMAIWALGQFAAVGKPARAQVEAVADRLPAWSQRYVTQTLAQLR